MCLLTINNQSFVIGNASLFSYIKTFLWRLTFVKDISLETVYVDTQPVFPVKYKNKHIPHLVKLSGAVVQSTHEV